MGTAQSQLPLFALFNSFVTVQAQSSYHTDEDLGVIHNALEVFRAMTTGIQQDIVSRVYLLVSLRCSKNAASHCAYLVFAYLSTVFFIGRVIGAAHNMINS